MNTHQIQPLHKFTQLFMFCIASLWCMNAAQAALLIENATLITVKEHIEEDFEGGIDKPFVGYLMAEDGVISAIGAGAYPDALPPNTEIIDATGKLVIPGFVSGHNHLWQSAFRGVALDQVLYPWLDALHRTYGPYFEGEDFYWFTLHGALDHLSHGITTTYNHSQRLNSSEEDYLGSLEAEVLAGQHFIFAYNNNTDLPADEMASAFDAFMARSVEIMNTPNSLMLGASVNAVGNFNGGEILAREIALVNKYGITAQLHYLEQFSSYEEEQKEWPLIKESGAIAPGISYAHFIHTSDEILEDTASMGASMIWNPLSNGRLASGLADIPRYRAMGIPVGMGVDGAASGDISDPFENMRMGMYALRMQHKNPNIMSAEQILRLHTLETAKVLGINDKVGSLEVGKLGDFLILDPAQPLTGPVINPVPHLVASMNAMNIESVYVNGELKVYKGEVLNHDTRAIQTEVVERVTRITAELE